MATASTAPRLGLPRRLHALRAGLRAALEPSGPEVDADTVTYLPPFDGRTEV